TGQPLGSPQRPEKPWSLRRSLIRKGIDAEGHSNEGPGRGLGSCGRRDQDRNRDLAPKLFGSREAAAARSQQGHPGHYPESKTPNRQDREGAGPRTPGVTRTMTAEGAPDPEQRKKIEGAIASLKAVLEEVEQMY